jgi:mannan endo-1,4-beta-mannosidase
MKILRIPSSRTRRWLSALCIALCTVPGYSQTVNFTVSINASPTPISPYIYGANPEFSVNENLGARRLGGNRLTGYNWENNASNAGTDYINSNDNYLTWIAGISNQNEPGIVTTDFHNQNLERGIYSLVTLQMAGYVAKDKNGEVLESETAPSSRWDKVQFTKGSTFSLVPSLTDTVVSIDEYVNFLVHTFGSAHTENGIKGYALDNEPALWPSTHPRIHPNQPTCQEIAQNGITLSNAVKNIDPYAEIFGPVLYGFGAYYNFQGASDWNTVKQGKSYSWFIDYYLDEMKKAESTYGKRLLDVLDIHWYPEATGDTRITNTNANSANDKAARLQAPRTLWCQGYRENSWIVQAGYTTYLPLIPKLKSSIDTYYPGTKIAFTEFTYGGESDITGALAIADVLGIFGKYGVYLATFWPVNDNTSYVEAAYRIFRNYDGLNSTFGDASVPSYTSDSVNTSIYSSVDLGRNEIHLIVIQKGLSSSKTATFSIPGTSSLTGGTVWILDNTSTQIKNAGALSLNTGNSFSYTLPAGSVCHFVLQASDTFVSHHSTQVQPNKIEIRTYPNPFNPSCKIEYTVPDDSEYTMTIVDIMGRVIKTYSRLSLRGSIHWDGKNEEKQDAASGVYCVVVRGGNQQSLSKKIVLIR